MKRPCAKYPLVIDNGLTALEAASGPRQPYKFISIDRAWFGKVHRLGVLGDRTLTYPGILYRRAPTRARSVPLMDCLATDERLPKILFFFFFVNLCFLPPFSLCLCLFVCLNVSLSYLSVYLSLSHPPSLSLSLFSLSPLSFLCAPVTVTTAKLLRLLLLLFVVVVVVVVVVQHAYIDAMLSI